MRFNVALAQQPSTRDPATTIAEAKKANANVVVFPEMYSNGYARFDPKDPAAIERWRNGAQTTEGSFIEQFRLGAISYQIYVVATFLEAADQKPFNSSLLINPAGITMLHHRKVYICDFDVPEVAVGAVKISTSQKSGRLPDQSKLV
jgi:predicted amidohydrolase